MRYDINCPYCETALNIDHEDGYGYEENVINKQRCSQCGKYFGYETTATFSYEPFEVDCFNGEEHDLVDTKAVHPSGNASRVKICTICGEEIIVDKEAHGKAMNELLKSMDKKVCGGLE